MKSILRLLTVAVILTAIPATALAVSKNEMDQARVETAKLYLRFANNMAGYLDEVNPASLDELQRALKNDKDKENLKVFLKASVDPNYSGWNKDQMVAYWSGEFLNANKSTLKEDVAGNQLYRAKVKGAVQKMKVAEAAPEPEAPKPEEATPAPEAQPEQTQVTPEQIGQSELAVEEDIAKANEEAAAEQAAEDEAKDVEEDVAKSGSNTWVYIMVLCILVAVVIGLVMFASRTMKAKQDPRSARERERERRAEERQRTVADDDSRQRYAEVITEKNDEIRMLSRKVNELNDRMAMLKADNERLKIELDEARRAVREAAAASAVAPTVISPVETAERRDHYDAAAERAYGEPRQDAEDKVIYLGRVNSRGIFVRADRNMRPGLSIYRLSTSNGLSGTFSVVRDPSVVNTAFEDPGKWLVGGCVSKDIFNTDRATEIITETPGTAVFEDGAWRVIRKAQIRYE